MDGMMVWTLCLSRDDVLPPDMSATELINEII